jgi:hypothetical protein
VHFSQRLQYQFEAGAPAHRLWIPLEQNGPNQFDRRAVAVILRGISLERGIGPEIHLGYQRFLTGRGNKEMDVLAYSRRIVPRNYGLKVILSVRPGDQSATVSVTAQIVVAQVARVPDFDLRTGQDFSSRAVDGTRDLQGHSGIAPAAQDGGVRSSLLVERTELVDRGRRTASALRPQPSFGGDGGFQAHTKPYHAERHAFEQQIATIEFHRNLPDGVWLKKDNRMLLPTFSRIVGAFLGVGQSPELAECAFPSAVIGRSTEASEKQRENDSGVLCIKFPGCLFAWIFRDMVSARSGDMPDFADMIGFCTEIAPVRKGCLEPCGEGLGTSQRRNNLTSE